MLAKMIYGDYPETMRELCSEEQATVFTIVDKTLVLGSTGFVEIIFIDLFVLARFQPDKLAI